jgi:hypothetical protein
VFVDSRLNQITNRNFVEASKLLQLDIINPSLTRFTLRDERLGLSQEFGHINLSEASEITHFLQAGSKGRIGLVVNSTAQSETSSVRPMNIMLSPNIPKSDIVGVSPRWQSAGVSQI